MRTGPEINLLFAWVWIFLGFASGLYLGLHFHRENWLGGYGSLKRRLYRLGHISFFGLGAVNFLFYFTAQRFVSVDLVSALATWGFILGGISMPLCCLVMAHHPRWRMLFSVPVISLLFAGACTLLKLINV